MERVIPMVNPYAYPREAHVRRHGPVYSTYESYRPWLEDEFSFRCVYCLKRMVWAPTHNWVIDHLVSVSEAPELEFDYDNCVFACWFCNSQKGPCRVADPCQVGYGSCLRVEPDGKITPLNPTGRKLVNTLSLNHPKQIEDRKKTMCLLLILAEHDDAEYQRLLGFPPELPDLENKNPRINLRPQGIAESCLARKKRGELPPVY